MKHHWSLRALTSASLALGATIFTPAFAEEPFSVQPSVRIEDTTGTLGDTDQLQSAIDRLASDYNVSFYVITIDSFENPTNSDEWVAELASVNSMGTSDIVLVIATEQRAAKLAAGSSDTLSESEVSSIYTDEILPHLRNSDYASAALAAAEGIENALASGGGAGVFTGIGTLAGVAAVAGGGAWLLSRGRKKGQRTTSGSTSVPTEVAGHTLASIAQLRAQAGELLVATDDAIVHSEQEVEFARLQYGEAQVAPFLQAITDAKAHMQRSFQLQKQLDDDIPDTEADQRAWLTEIIGRCQEAQQALKKQEQNFTSLRQLEKNAPDVLAALETRLGTLSPKFDEAESALAQLKASFAESAYEAVADNIEQARGREEFALEAVQSAQSLLESNRSEAILEIRAGEEALGQAEGLLASLVKAQSDLIQAQESLESAIMLAQRDVAQARELAKYEATSQLAGAAAGVSAVIEDIHSESKQPRTDPLALTRKLQEVRSELDAALESVREIQERERSARASLTHALASAQAQVSSASEYVWARRGGVKAEARTRLREAERHLGEAQKLQKTDPVAALSHANNAIRLAGEAQKIARDDVDHFNNSGFGGASRGRSDNSALLGGILLGTLLGGNGGPGGGHHGGGHFGGGGSFGGGFGGGSGGFSGGGFGGPSAGGTF